MHLGKWGRRLLGGHDFGICEAKNGTEADELLQAGKDGHTGIWQHAEKNSNSRRRQTSQQRRQQIGELKDKRKESRERSIRG